MHHRHIIAAALLVIANSALATEDPRPCELDKGRCGTQPYYVVVPDKTGPECKTLCYNEAPNHPTIECFGSGTIYYCEAWPRGSGLTYQWTSQNALLGDNSITPSPYMTVYCGTSVNTASITVSAQSPFGLWSSAATVYFTCGLGQDPE